MRDITTYYSLHKERIKLKNKLYADKMGKQHYKEYNHQYYLKNLQKLKSKHKSRYETLQELEKLANKTELEKVVSPKPIKLLIDEPIIKRKLKYKQVENVTTVEYNENNQITINFDMI